MISQLRSTPNLLTLLRLVFVPVTVIAVLEGKYGWALALFITAGITDGLDGLLARILEQKTVLGQYLDPIADKLLLSTMFLVLASRHRIPAWVTVLVFSRDIIILIVCTLVYAVGAMRVFQPSLFGKANTVVQIATVPLVLFREVSNASWVAAAKTIGIYLTIALTVFSGIHYVVRLAFDLKSTAGRTANPANRSSSPQISADER
ncbi:MAG TPA: CDP-alcohol phosphatidyltransferase family protein [Candidatus Angelobacter sp.]|jgi:cardiolipin synthase|nr:CDP-alcohol phosphatidyltransferase family protein [Candidatus Angelobacter sp.]